MAELALNDEYFPKSPVGTGTSQAFNELAKFTKNMFLDSSLALIYERPKDLRDELIDTYKECSVDNWDSYGSLPLKEGALFEAEKLEDREDFLSPNKSRYSKTIISLKRIPVISSSILLVCPWNLLRFFSSQILDLG